MSGWSVGRRLRAGNAGRVAIAALATALATGAGATTYTWTGGNYQPGVTSPNPLLTPDILSIETAGNHFFDGVGFTNQSGTVNWVDGAIYLLNGATVQNQSLWRTTSDNGLFYNGGPGPSFTNSGTFQKSGGLGDTTVANIGFTNSGTIQADTGRIVFSGGDAKFNAGSTFSGAGAVAITANAAFNGAQTSNNTLDFLSGVYSGTAATLSGTADFVSGYFAGGWTVNGGATLNATGTGNKFFETGTFTNAGTFAWAAGDLFLENGAAIVNSGTWNASGDNSLNYNGGSGPSFTNNGTFRKSAGGGDTSVYNIGFVNNGTVQADTGRIVFGGGDAKFNAGSIFTGNGIVAVTTNAQFNGGFTSSNLDLIAGVYSGSAAALTGAADFFGGYFTGGWTVNSGATLNAVGGGNKFFDAGTFTNAGTFAWAAGDLYLENGAALTNSGSWTASSDNGLYYNGGPGPGFTNNGTFRKSAGVGDTTVANIGFVNNGTVQADTGRIVFTGNDERFNNGSAFTGAGIVAIQSNAQFNGGFTSSNLDLLSGLYTGSAAALTGSADFFAGTFTGGWTVNGGATLNAVGGGNKFFDAGSFANAGTVAWAAGDLYLQNGAALTNTGTWNASSDNGLFYNGGPGPSFTNNGTVLKSAGAGDTTIANIGFVNNATIQADTGRILFTGNDEQFNAGTVFTGAGTVAIQSNAQFNGGFTSSNLDFNSGTYSGTGAALSGSADFLGGSFVGGWTVNAGATFNELGGANKFFDGGTFTNAGTFNWAGGDMYLSNGDAFTNSGTINATTGNAIYYNGGSGPSLTNNGLIVKTGTGTTTTIGNSLAFDNNGTIDVRSGTVALPNDFANDGTLEGTGTFSLAGTLTNNGTMAPGIGGTGIGTLNLTGGYAQTALGNLSIQLSSISSYDLLNISGTASLAGSLSLFCASCTLNAGELYTVLDSVGDLTGMFATTTATGFNPGFDYTVLYDTALDRVQVRINAVGNPLPPVAGGVPEPATWLSMILGFALVGGSLRRRRMVAVTA